VLEGVHAAVVVVDVRPNGCLLRRRGKVDNMHNASGDPPPPSPPTPTAACGTQNVTMIIGLEYLKDRRDGVCVVEMPIAGAPIIEWVGGWGGGGSYDRGELDGRGAGAVG
jgi:hypothetical protein